MFLFTHTYQVVRVSQNLTSGAAAVAGYCAVAVNYYNVADSLNNYDDDTDAGSSTSYWKAMLLNGL